MKYLIFIEDQIHPTDRTGYKPGVEVLSFTEVCALGKEKMGQYQPVRPTQVRFQKRNNHEISF